MFVSSYTNNKSREEEVNSSSPSPSISNNYEDTKEFNKPSYNEDRDQLEKKRKEEENGETRIIITRNQAF
jgi:hypothetical protein